MAKQADFDLTGSVPVTLAPEERERIGAEIERMIALLDAADTDPDLEPCCEDEGAQCEDEAAQCDDEGAVDVDLEPSLGWSADVSQARAIKHCTGLLALPNDRWVGRNEDLELDEADREPSLAILHGGARPEGFDQRDWGRGGTRDLEEQCEDEGSEEHCE